MTDRLILTDPDDEPLTIRVPPGAVIPLIGGTVTMLSGVTLIRAVVDPEWTNAIREDMAQRGEI